MSRWSILLAVAACSHSPHIAEPPPVSVPDAGRHREQVEAQVKPFFDAELLSGLVVGLYDDGKTEVYGFGTGPNNATPDGTTLFEVGPITKVYTSLLLADAVQRREVDLDTPIAELMPPGVTVPIRDKVVITLKHLALHAAGLPRLPPSLITHVADPDPYAAYSEDRLYHDLIQTELDATPGTQITYSDYGVGLLGFALGKKLGGGYAKVIVDRVLGPLELKDTFLVVPAALGARRAAGTTDDLAKAAPWTFDALAGAAALVSTARDQLRLIEVELDAAAGGTLPLRHAMKLTQDPQLDRPGDNEGLGWMIDSAGRYWHNGGTGGFHAFVGFDTKAKRGVVLLASTATSLVDRLPDAMYRILDNASPPPVKFPSAADLAPFIGTYELGGTKLQVLADGKRLYLEAAGEPRRRLSPLSDHEFWLEVLQSVAVFEKEGDKVARVVFGIGGHKLVAQRVDPK
ncbi:MAG TPA: serine hydrolase domain-containing protein [Kofleriaceae bacterium]|jgi:CubicO group peptidase (beta-lactamase class C family)|nr:serine hydrolase domain-containing protein [Kofleriaceae bacterium]